MLSSFTVAAVLLSSLQAHFSKLSAAEQLWGRQMYSSATYEDDLMLAAAWMYKATGTSAWLSYAEAHYAVINLDSAQYAQPVYNWDNQYYAGCLLLWTETQDRKYATQVSCLPRF